MSVRRFVLGTDDGSNDDVLDLAEAIAAYRDAAETRANAELHLDALLRRLEDA
jgi:hypothetical protein